jgi:hypothetical protein
MYSETDQWQAAIETGQNALALAERTEARDMAEVLRQRIAEWQSAAGGGR